MDQVHRLIAGGILDGDAAQLLGRVPKNVAEGPEKTTRGGEWDPIKIPYQNLAYIPKSTRHPSLLTPSKLHSYGTAIGPQNWVRNHSENMNRC
jgi:hypothetical protein